MRSPFVLAALLLIATTASASVSVITARPDDPEAVYLSGPAGDGITDDSDAVQHAIDAVYDRYREGIVFVPQGRYRVTRTIYLWPGVRLIGYGSTRPIFVLAPNTPGYGDGIADMFFFAGARPPSAQGSTTASSARFRLPPAPPGTVPPAENIADANPGTFYSAMSNVDFEIGDGNPGAVAIRFHAAQHAFLAHIDFHIGSGFAAIHEVANEAEDLHFYGGLYGIMARKPSPAWQFTLLDSTFEGQREAAIRENEVGLTLVNIIFRNVPTAVDIDEHYSDWLWIKNAHFENVSGPALIISNENSRLTQINVEDSSGIESPIFARLRESGKEFRAPTRVYSVQSFTHGLTFRSIRTVPEIQSIFHAHAETSAPIPLPRAIRALPPFSEWVNVHTLGVKGDGKTDDTEALRRAIERYPTLYIPSGRYLISDTITLRPDTALIGLHPSRTQFDLAENTPAFRAPGPPRPAVLAPAGGNAIVSGIGIFTGGLNGRAAGLLWRSGKDSLVDDVRFLGGHGTNTLDGSRINPYNNTHTADPDLHKPWDAQYPSLWIDGGGGTFANIWTPDTYAQAGMRISNTEIPGYAYQVSSEHHVRAEFQLNRVAHWSLYAPQTEAESGESPSETSLEIDSSHDITIANYHGYRVTHSEYPFPYAVRVSRSRNIHFRNVHVDSNSSIGLCTITEGCRQIVRPNKVPFENSIADTTDHINVRDREFAYLDLSTSAAPPTIAAKTGTPNAVAPRRLANGFFNISGAAVDSKGDLYFVDAHFQRIYHWNPQTEEAEIVRDAPQGPVNLVFDKSDNLVVLSSLGTEFSAYAIHPDEPESVDAFFKLLPLQPASPHPGNSVALPVDYWFNGDFSNTLSAAQPYTYITLDQMFRNNLGSPRTHQFVSPDGSLIIPTDLPIVQGEPFWGTKWVHALDAYGLVKASPGDVFYAMNEAEQRTYRGKLNAEGVLEGITLFAGRGGESLVVDKAGNIYIAAGDIFVYSHAGRLLLSIPLPERPHDLIFGGTDGRTLYALSEHSLYAVRVSN